MTVWACAFTTSCAAPCTCVYVFVCARVQVCVCVCCAVSCDPYRKIAGRRCCNTARSFDCNPGRAPPLAAAPPLPPLRQRRALAATTAIMPRRPTTDASPGIAHHRVRAAAAAPAASAPSLRLRRRRRRALVPNGKARKARQAHLAARRRAQRLQVGFYLRADVYVGVASCRGGHGVRSAVACQSRCALAAPGARVSRGAARMGTYTPSYSTAVHEPIR
jgi:hypothetical protein